jgi:hypothetical protein
MEAVRTSETSVDNHFTRQYNPEDNSEHHTRRRENLKSHIYKLVCDNCCHGNVGQGFLAISSICMLVGDNSLLRDLEPCGVIFTVRRSRVELRKE